MGEQPNKILFLIGGNAGAGKDSFADYLRGITTLWDGTYSTAYAYGIKKILHETYGTPWEILNGDKDVKESNFVYMGKTQTKITIRRALQKVGQFHRETFGPTCWAAATLTRCKQSQKRICIVTDARHPAEEIHWIGEQASSVGFLVVPVRIRRASVPVNPDHPSESLIVAEPDGSFSFLIDNEGSLADLKRAAEQVACAAVLLQKSGSKKLSKKKDLAWVVRAENGYLPYEPMLSAEDADLLCEQLIDSEGFPHSAEVVMFDSLKGAACGN